MFASTSGQTVSNQSTTVLYGSAELQGFLWKDYTCLQALNLTGEKTQLVNGSYMAKITDKNWYNYTIDNEKRFLEKAYDF
jgi:hypothetical protein